MALTAIVTMAVSPLVIYSLLLQSLGYLALQIRFLVQGRQG